MDRENSASAPPTVRMIPEEALRRAMEALKAGDWDLAESLAWHLCEAGHRFPDCLQILGACCTRRGDAENAARFLSEFVESMTPSLATALVTLGRAFQQLGRPREAEAALRKAAALVPDDGAAAHELANVLHAQGELVEASVHYGRAVTLIPDSAPIRNGFGAALAAQQLFAPALEQFEKAFELSPNATGTAFNLGQALFALGEADRALAYFRKAEAMGHSPTALSMQAVIIPGCHGIEESEILATRRRFCQTLLHEPMDRPDPKHHPPHAGGRIRIGYVSAFFNNRNWMKPVWGAVNRHDRQQFEIHFLSQAPLIGIPAGYVADSRDFLHDIASLDNASLADFVRSKEIDVLVDLNGYSHVPGLGLFPHRSAPLQFAWFGMYATSGLPVFDALIADSVVIPPGDEPFFSEPILRVPGTHLAFDVRYAVPPIVPPPAQKAGFVTFGCLAPLYKLHPRTLAAFSRILQETPDSRLLLRARSLDGEPNRAWLTAQFERLGITPDRLILLGGAEHYEFLETYSSIDIALDTHPYNGGTTTMEACWQGVPLLAFLGRRLIERQSATLLLAAGLQEYVATDLEGFVQKAVRMAGEVRTSEHADRRMSARERVAASPACDSLTLSRNLEVIFRNHYQAWLHAG